MAETKQWYVYILECKDDSVYTGITTDLEKRMKVHESGKGSKYVKSKKFKRLLHAVRVTDKVEAAKIEYKIKQMKRNDKITYFMKHPNREYSVVKQNMPKTAKTNNI